jgi:CheY-like chemotaxis protein
VHTDPTTVLVVDDEETICEIVKRSLQDLGLVCITAPSGAKQLSSGFTPVSRRQICSLWMSSCQA